jgi:hypothetical protein
VTRQVFTVFVAALATVVFIATLATVAIFI